MRYVFSFINNKRVYCVLLVYFLTITDDEYRKAPPRIGRPSASLWLTPGPRGHVFSSLGFYKLRALLPMPIQNMMRIIIYPSLFWAIFQYGLLVWRGLNRNAVRPQRLVRKKKTFRCQNRVHILKIRWVKNA